VRVLLVEDDAKLARVLGRGLREEGAIVELAGSGEAALTAVCASSFDVVVLDVMLPGIDGFQTCRALRAEGVSARC